jgi:site-specific recombinase XerD
MTPTTELALVPTAATQLVDMTLATCQSINTRKAYRNALEKFLATGLPLTREGVALHLQQLRDSGTSNSTVITALAAIKKLAREAEVRDLMTAQEVFQISTVSPGKMYKTRVGRWLTIEQVRQLLAAPNPDTYFGKRDACILHLMAGCGLRRSEMAILPWTCYQEREGRMCLVNLKGKGGKDRTLPVPSWAQAAVDVWYLASRKAPPPGVTSQEMAVEAVRKVNNELITGGLGYEGLKGLIEKYGQQIGVRLSCHDLRRTLSQMMRRGGAPLEQIQATLGHAHLSTTSLYLGSALELALGAANVDQLDLHRLPAAKPVVPVAVRQRLRRIKTAKRARAAIEAQAARDRKRRDDYRAYLADPYRRPAIEGKPSTVVPATVINKRKSGFTFHVYLSCGHRVHLPLNTQQDIFIGMKLLCRDPHDENGKAIKRETNGGSYAA